MSDKYVEVHYFFLENFQPIKNANAETLKPTVNGQEWTFMLKLENSFFSVDADTFHLLSSVSLTQGCRHQSGHWGWVFCVFWRNLGG